MFIRSFAKPAALVLGFLGACSSARADFTVLLNNLDQAAKTSAASNFMGQSFISGNQGSQLLQGVEMNIGTANSNPSGIHLELESRNQDGSVGVTLDTDFSSSFNAATGLITFTANHSYVMTAATGYWLVLSHPVAGSSTLGVSWDFTSSNVYQSNHGYGLASFNTSFASSGDNGTGTISYYQPSDGPQLFALLAPSATVPEPSSFLILGIGGSLAGLARFLVTSRASRPRRDD